MAIGPNLPGFLKTIQVMKVIKSHFAIIIFVCVRFKQNVEVWKQSMQS